MKNRVLTALSLLLCTLPLLAASLPREEAVPGGIVLIDLGPHDAAAPQVRYEGKRVLVQAVDNHWWAVVGIPLDTAVGEQSLSVQESGAQPRQISFVISDKHYTEQHLTLKNKRMVEPNKDDLKRIKSDQALSRAAFNHWSDAAEVAFDFALPTDGPMSSPFGLRRFFNEQPRAPHSGIDIAAPLGAEVRAPAGGTVIAVGDLFFNGKSVFIDHGQGLVTMYCHLDTINVKKGQHLKQGELFATVGKSGRATGPHLHWSASLNNARIDPRLLLAPAAVAAITPPAAAK